MSKYLIGLVLVIFSSLSWGLTLDELATRLAKQPLVRADFKQTKQIKGLSKPLQSTGTMIFVRDKGLYWHQQHPFDLILVLTESTMIQIVNNQDKQVITAESNPQMFQFNHVLTAIFKADKAVLERSFSTELIQDHDNAWVLTLYPTVSPLDKIFNVITLSGHEFVEQVVLDDKQGDKTIIEFLKQTTQPALNTLELNYFVP